MASGPLGVCLANMNSPVLLAGSTELRPRGLIHLLGFVKPQEEDGGVSVAPGFLCGLTIC